MADLLNETQREEVAELVQREIERFGRLIVVELAKIRVDATAAEIGRAIDNAVRRFKFEEVPA